MARKRQNTDFTSSSSSFSKKPRFYKPSETPLTTTTNEEPDTTTRQTASMVLVNGLTNDCSVLNLKSRFEMYGCISRSRIDRGVGYISFRSKDSAEAAIAASLDPAFGITIDSHKVHVSWPIDPQWREGARVSVKERLSSTLTLPDVPLSRHGRGNKLNSANLSPKIGSDLSYRARDIITYDDLF